MSSGHIRLRTWFLVALLALASVFGFMVLTLSLRYGGPGGLWLRVRAEVTARRPHPEFVPTPLPVSSDVSSAWRTEDATKTEESGFVAAAQTMGQTATPAASTARSMGAAAVPSSEPIDTRASLGTAGDQVPAVAPLPLHKSAAERVELTGFSHMWQTWNNCGPATLAMDLNYFDIRLDQARVAAALKPNRDDKNVSPEEMAEFVRGQGLHALVRINGDADRLHVLLSNGLPVLVETWLEPEPNDGMGHYRLLTGYDNASRQWVVFDSYVSIGVDPDQPYRGIRLPYEEMETLWAVFNRTYVLLYTDEQAPIVHSILGDDADSVAMWQRALHQARARLEMRPNDPFAWFNLASDLVALDQFEEAAAAYDQARVIGLPWRMLWYQFGAFQAYYETGRYQELITLADSTIKSAGGNIEEIYYWKGLGLNAQGDQAGARQAWQRALELNPNYAEAAAALEAISPSNSQGGQAIPAAAEPGG